MGLCMYLGGLITGELFVKMIRGGWGVTRGRGQLGLSRLRWQNPKKALAKMAKKCSKSAQNLKIGCSKSAKVVNS